jgi:hypothetical protein
MNGHGPVPTGVSEKACAYVLALSLSLCSSVPVKPMTWLEQGALIQRRHD